jgi:hypothetical protein
LQWEREYGRQRLHGDWIAFARRSWQMYDHYTAITQRLRSVHYDANALLGIHGVFTAIAQHFHSVHHDVKAFASIHHGFFTAIASSF